MTMMTTKTPLISVITPIYGVEKFIEGFAVSLFEQTYENIEYIFVNDATKDSSMTILKNLIEERYSHLEDKIMILDKEVNEGLPKARKDGLAVAHGDYILHVDSDDWMDKDMVEQLAAKAIEGDYDIVYCDFYYEWDERTEIISEPTYTATSKDKAKFLNDILDWGTANAYTWNKLIAARVYKNPVKHPKYSYHEDLLLTCQLICYAKSIAHVQKPLYHYRKDNMASISNDPATERRRKMESRSNLLELYRFLKNFDDRSIYDYVMDNILYYVGWYAFKFDRDWIKTHPELKYDLKEVTISQEHLLPLPKQIIIRSFLGLSTLMAKMRQNLSTAEKA